MVSLLSAGSEGQWVRAEDREGADWEIECLGEPVEVGARIAFEPVGRAGAGRGVLVRVLDAKRDAWVCTLRRAGGRLELTPFGGLEAPPLHLVEADAADAPDGARVVVVPRPGPGGGRRRGAGRGGPRTGAGRALPVRVAEVLGPAGDPDADHRALRFKHRLPDAFSRRARLEAEAIDPRADDEERARRLDLRGLPFVTIDPATARDHDDAVYAEPRPAEPLRVVGGREGSASREARPAGWTHRLWVAIADVAHFVPAGSFVDAEARRRGNSFYFPDRALPMLPERLSSDLCSLRPGEDRRALVVELRLDASGEVRDALFHEALIRSRARLAYEEAAAFVGNAATTSREAIGDEPEWGASLRCLATLAERLGEARRRSGAIELELPEVEVVLDASGRPRDARLRERSAAHRWIEEAMLAANRAVAAALVRAGHDTLHRVHPEPSPRRLEALAGLLERHGLEAPAEGLEEPGELARVLEAARGHPAEERLHEAALRAMAQARYEPSSGGHFALCFEHYLHFTSPIRRYADLEVHRALRRLIRGLPPDRSSREDGRSSPEGTAAPAARLAIWLSARERVAMEAEREALALACCVLLAGREGERFEARVTAASEYGLFVRLDSPAASGLVPMRLLEGEWRHDPEEEVLVGPRSGARLGAGDRLVVRLVAVDLDRVRIAFAMDGPGRRGKSGGRTSGSARGGAPDEWRGASARRGSSDGGSSGPARRGGAGGGRSGPARRGGAGGGRSGPARRGGAGGGRSGPARRGGAGGGPESPSGPAQSRASSRAASSSERRSQSR